jgi:hypothetical protein
MAEACIADPIWLRTEVLIIERVWKGGNPRSLRYVYNKAMRYHAYRRDGIDG